MTSAKYAEGFLSLLRLSSAGMNPNQGFYIDGTIFRTTKRPTIIWAGHELLALIPQRIEGGGTLMSSFLNESIIIFRVSENIRRSDSDRAEMHSRDFSNT